jgi:hypothetical protein
VGKCKGGGQDCGFGRGRPTSQVSVGLVRYQVVATCVQVRDESTKNDRALIPYAPCTQSAKKRNALRETHLKGYELIVSRAIVGCVTCNV